MHLNNFIKTFYKYRNDLIKGKIRTSKKVEQINNNILDHSYFESIPQFSKVNDQNLDNYWLSGFSDADSNFSINIHKRTNKNSMRVQLFFRIEVRQTYHKLDSGGNKVSFFPIMSILAKFLDVNVYSRSRVKKDKEYL